MYDLHSAQNRVHLRWFNWRNLNKGTFYRSVDRIKSKQWVMRSPATEILRRNSLLSLEFKEKCKDTVSRAQWGWKWEKALNQGYTQGRTQLPSWMLCQSSDDWRKYPDHWLPTPMSVWCFPSTMIARDQGRQMCGSFRPAFPTESRAAEPGEQTGRRITTVGFPGSSEGKASACNQETWVSIHVSGRSPGEGNGNPLWYSCLENPMDGEAW